MEYNLKWSSDSFVIWTPSVSLSTEVYISIGPTCKNIKNASDVKWFICTLALITLHSVCMWCSYGGLCLNPYEYYMEM